MEEHNTPYFLIELKLRTKKYPERNHSEDLYIYDNKTSPVQVMYSVDKIISYILIVSPTGYWP